MTSNYQTNENLESIKLAAELLDGDTWHTEGNSVYGSAYDAGDSVCYDLIASCESINGESPKAEFIASADPNTMLALIAEVQEYRNAKPIAWINEDELPKSYPYDAMFPLSKVDIVRLFPVYGPQSTELVVDFISSALSDVAAERQRQQSIKGYSVEQDDTYIGGELAAAAISYIEPLEAENYWPADWHDDSFKPSDYRRNLVKATALLLAEIERIDRQERANHEQR